MEGRLIHGHLLTNGLHSNAYLNTNLVIFYSKLGDMVNSRKVFDRMSERSLVTWTALVLGYSQNGDSEEALVVFSAMHRIGVNVKANQFTYGSALRACTSMIPDSFTLGSIMKALVGGSSLMKVIQIHGFIIQLGCESHTVLIGSLIDVYANCGSVRIADRIYKSMLKKDTIACAALITGYAREASLDLGRQIHGLVLKCQSKHDVAMGNTLIDMYSKSGEIEDAKQVFNEMKQKNVISWTSLIAGYGKHGYKHKAIGMYKKMESEGLKPNDVTFLTLLFACSHAA
ncbi:hypothetical protein ACSBR1_029285 [Camellia fascicularis]